MVTVIKRDGTLVDFDISKIINAISKASKSVHEIPSSAIEIMAKSVENKVKNQDKISVEFIQDEVEKILIENNYSDIAKSYILYRDQRTRARDASSYITKTIHDLTNVNKDTNNKRENANINADSTMGTMLKYGSETAKWYNLRNVIRPKHAELHTKGIIHIHDLDFYSLCTNCTQIPLDKLFENGGFFTGHGYLRTPNSIGTAASLAAIAIQSSQNDFFGGQSIPMFDFYMAPYVKKSYIKNIASIVEIEENEEYANEVKEKLTSINKDNDSLLNKDRSVIVTIHSVCKDKDLSTIEKWIKLAKKRTDKDTYQAMEGLVHNLNTLACRSGSQVPFSSINFGMDTSEEGRMVSKNLMLAQEAGLGNGETAIFPITIFSIMPGYNYNPEDPNYDLFKLSCRVSAKRLFPNWNNVGATWNKKYFKEGHPETIVSVMGILTGDEVVLIKNKENQYITKIKDLIDGIFINQKPKKALNVEDTFYLETNDLEIWDNNKFTKIKKVLKWENCTSKWYKVTIVNTTTNEQQIVKCSHDHPWSIMDTNKNTYSRIKTDDIIPIINENKYCKVNSSSGLWNIISIDETDPIKVGYDFETESDTFSVTPSIVKSHIEFNDKSILSHNCVSADSKIIIKDPSGKIHFTTASFFKTCDSGITYLNKGWQILSNGKFVDLINVSLRKEENDINVIKAAHGYIRNTDEHIVPVIRKRQYLEIPVKDIQIDDCLVDSFPVDSSIEEQRLYEINLINKLPFSEDIDVVFPDQYTSIVANYIDSGDIKYNQDMILYSTLVKYKLIRNKLLDIPEFKEDDLRILYHKSKTSIPVILPLTREFGRFIGLLYSEGCVHSDYFVTITNSNKDIINFTVDFFNKYFNYEAKVTYNKNNTAIISMSNKLLHKLFRNGILGYHFGSGDLKIPNWYYSANIDFLKGFISGVIDGDGSVVPQNYTRIITASETFAEGLQYVLKMLNCVSCVSIDYLAGTEATFGDIKSIRKYNNYRVTIDNRDVLEMDLYDSIKVHNLDGIEFKPRARDQKYGNRVFSIEKVAYNNYVYDFETGDNHFDCNMQNVHNCRTRVIGNVWRPDLEVTPGRGNLSFTSINLPYIALEVNGDINRFFIRLDEIIDNVIVQLMDRYKIQSKRKAKNFPFTIQQGATIDGDKLEPEDELGDILRNGTLSIAYVGLAECLIALIGKHHGESEEAQELGIRIIKHMRKRMDDEAQKTKYNFSLIAAPAEGTCGTFADAIKKQFGIIKGISDKDFLTNGNHVPVYYNCTISHKVDVEAPYHELCNAGNIFYAEYDGDPLDNLEAFESIVRYAVDSDMGYISINHAVDRCSVCNYVGVIKDKCPRCGRTEDEWPTKEKLLELKKIYPNIRIPDWMK